MNGIFSIALFALILAGSVGVMELFQQQRRLQSTMDAHVAAALIRSNLSTHIQNSTALTNTLNSPENSPIFDCIRNGTPCGSAPSNINVIRDAANQVVLDTRGTGGVAMSGLICYSYSAAGNSDCPFRLAATWQPVCAPPCTPPLVMRFSFTFTYSPGQHQQAPFSPLSHNFVLDRPSP